MTEMAGLLSILAVAGLAGWALMSLAALGAARLIGTGEVRPAVRRSRAEWLAAMPLGGFLLGVLAVLLPAVLKAAGFIADHCLVHGLHHPHICFTHLPAFAPGLPLATLITGSLVAGAAEIVRWTLRQHRDRSLARRIERLASSRWPVLTADVPGPQAFLLGPERHRVVLSESFSRQLSPSERRAVLRHEIAHARAGDPRRKRWLEFLLVFHPPFLRRSLRERWQQSVEELADDRVAEQGGALDLAQALVKAARLEQPGTARMSSAMAVTAADLARRVHRLTGDRTASRGPVPMERLLPFLPVALVAWATANHHALEHLLETVLAWLTGG